MTLQDQSQSQSQSQITQQPDTFQNEPQLSPSQNVTYPAEKGTHTIFPPESNNQTFPQKKKHAKTKSSKEKSTSVQKKLQYIAKLLKTKEKAFVQQQQQQQQPREELTTEEDMSNRSSHRPQQNQLIPKHESFLSDQPQEIQQLYNVYKLSVSQSDTPQETLQQLDHSIQLRYNLSPDVSRLIAHDLSTTFSSPQFRTQIIDTSQTSLSPTDTQQISLSLKDYTRYAELVQSDTQSSEQLKLLLLSFLIFYRRNYHKTGWVRYDRKNIFNLAGLAKETNSNKEKMIAQLHSLYDIDMQVVGSNQPIVCYKIPWIENQVPTPGSENNPMINLGPMTYENLKGVTKKIQ